MSAGVARGRATARLAAVCAVLFGLFLMHGAPASAAGGCHGSLSMGAAMHGDHGDHGDHGGSAMAPAGVHPIAVHPGPAVRAGTEPGTRGAVCVSTPARDRTLLGPAGLSGGLAVLALVAARSSVGRPLLPGRTGRRGPPRSGRSLLLQVCVARA
ncbi:hypothetical protein OG285_34315 [Streptomyces sp. NBC_01471]|uniref:hypothetical protein n=1 Tax=Streptomyces sp. NBC_01471 TaxID=2903879 RepID=UPI003246CEEB